jgi:hypothetical protein
MRIRLLGLALCAPLSICACGDGARSALIEMDAGSDSGQAHDAAAFHDAAQAHDAGPGPEAGPRCAASRDADASSQETCDGTDNDCDGRIDEDLLPHCLDSDQLQRCRQGKLETTSCNAAGQTCNVNGCMGECSKGRQRCAEAGQAQQLCDGTGQWGSAVPCESGDICEPSSGRCVSNSATSLGHAEAGSSILNADSGDLYATPIYSSESVELLYLGVMTSNESSGGSAMIGLYADDTSKGGHRPGTIITYTSSFGLAAGSQNSHTPRAKTTLAAGTFYWLVLNLYEGSSDSVQLYSYPAQKLDGWDTQYLLDFNQWGSALPNAFPQGSLVSPGEVGLHADVQKAP